MAAFDKAKLAWTLPWDVDWVTAVSFIGKTRRVAAGNRRGDILVWDLPDKPEDKASPPIRRLEGHTNAITRLLSTADGRWLISASYDHTIRFWDMQAPAQGEATVMLNERARYLASQRRGRKVPDPVEVKVEVQKSSKTLEGHDDWICALTMSRDEKLLVSGDDKGQLVIWDRSAGKELRRISVKGWTYALALSPDSKEILLSERIPLIFNSGSHAAVKIYDQATGQMKHDLSKQFSRMHIASAAYSPDGKLLVLGRGGEADGKLYLVDPAKAKKSKDLSPSHRSGVTDILFHPDGQHFASAGRDTTVRIWNKEGKLVKELGKGRGGQFKDWIHSVSFNADGTMAAGGDMAGAVQVWCW